MGKHHKTLETENGSKWRHTSHPGWKELICGRELLKLIYIEIIKFFIYFENPQRIWGMGRWMDYKIHQEKKKKKNQTSENS